MTAPPHRADASLAATLVESDRLYFELGARLLPLTGASMAWTPGMEATPAGCVVQRVRPGHVGLDARAWVRAVTERFRALGCATARVYLDDPASALDEALAEEGFRRRVEIGYLARAPLPARRQDVVLRPVAGDEDWEAKRKLHAGSALGPDGHVVPGDAWVDLERRKCEAGAMTAHLLVVDGEVCGGIATLAVGDLLRAKNIFVHPDRGREGIGAQAMHLVSRRAREMGKRATGIFGVDGKPGNALYRRLRMEPAVRQLEWTKPLP